MNCRFLHRDTIGDSFQNKSASTLLGSQHRRCPLLSSGAGDRYRLIYAAGARAAANQLHAAAAVDRRDRRTDGHRRRRNGGVDGGARPRNVQTTGARVSFRPRNISHISACLNLNFHSLSLCCLHTIKTSHSATQQQKILTNKKHTGLSYP